MRLTAGQYNRRVLETVAHYRILERIGASHLGELFRARDTRVGRTVALVIPSNDIQDDPSQRALLLSDAHKAMTISHPNIAALYEANDDAGQMYLAFEFVPGEPLDRVIAGHPLNVRRALDLAGQIADALADAHAAEIAHGALDAKNVVVTPKGNAKILDFGIARWTHAAGSIGDDTADVRALGELLFEMLTGRRPTPATPPSTLNKSLPAEVDEIAAKPYQSAVTFAADVRSLAAVLQVRAEATEKSRPMPGRAVSRKSKGPWRVAMVAIIAAVVAAAWWWLLRHR